MEPPIHTSLEAAHKYQERLIKQLTDYQKHFKKLNDEIDKLKLELLKYRGY